MKARCEQEGDSLGVCTPETGLLDVELSLTVSSATENSEWLVTG